MSLGTLHDWRNWAACQCGEPGCRSYRQHRPLVDYQHARDIPDIVFLRAVAAVSRHGLWSTRWDVAQILGGFTHDDPHPDIGDVPGVPWRVVLAKFRRVRGRGLVTGCDCSCRGDFRLTDKGRRTIKEADAAVARAIERIMALVRAMAEEEDLTVTCSRWPGDEG